MVRQLQDERDQRDAEEDAKLQQALATHESSVRKKSVAGSFRADGSGSPTKEGEAEFDFDAAENQVHLGPYFLNLGRTYDSMAALALLSQAHLRMMARGCNYMHQRLQP